MMNPTQNRNAPRTQQLAIGLGWFSIGLGLAELIAPRQVARLIGADAKPDLLRTLGLREIANGIGILTAEEPAKWLWARVGGDVLDLGLLGAALESDENRRGKIATTVAAVAGITVLDILSARLLHGVRETENAVSVQHAVIIDRAPDELYNFWRDLRNLPRFIPQLTAVEDLGNGRSRWQAAGPGNLSISWDAELTDDREGTVIAWKSLENADLRHSGEVSFEPAWGARGTMVTIKIRYKPPGGATGAALARIIGRFPDKHVRAGLLRFKQLIETGEVSRTSGQPAGRARSLSSKYDVFAKE